MLDTAEPSLIVDDPRDAERIFGVLTRAFATDPPTRWLFPELDDHQQHFPTFARALGGSALAGQTAFTSADYAAIALWLAPGVGPDEAALANLVEEGVRPEKRLVMAGVVEEMGRCHPDEPHWYLPLIGVEPTRQGSGLGAALLRHTLAMCDGEKLPAYLESTNPRNRPLYERHGFKAIGEIRLGDCPPIVPMLRRPQPLHRGYP